jgi:hypothetical protein
MTTQTTTKPLFPLGDTYCTPECLAEILSNGETPSAYFHRHQHGDFGDLGQEDIAENYLSIREGFRVLSAYVLPVSGVRIYIITEAGCGMTTALLCSEY